MAGDLNNHKVLITGGTGYLGGSIGEYLALAGYDVYLGSRKPFSRGIVQGCSQISTNWEDKNLEFCKGFKTIIHAAGMNAKDCINNPEKAHIFNGKFTENLIKKSSEYECNNFIYLSTVHVYKSPLKGVINESTPISNNHPYASSHHYGEQALIKAVKKNTIKGTVLRLSNCFGPGVTRDNECWELALNQFVHDAVIKGSININGNFLATRDFLPLTEFNRILQILIENINDLPNIINISTEKSRSLLDVANLVAQIAYKTIGKPVSVNKNNSFLDEDSFQIKNSALYSMGISVNNNLELEIKKLIESI